MSDNINPAVETAEQREAREYKELELEETRQQAARALTGLKLRADAKGIKYSPNIGAQTLLKKIEEHDNKDLNDTKKDNIPEASDPRRVTSKMPSKAEILEMSEDNVINYPPIIRKRIIRVRQMAEFMKLIRCQIFNNDPKKNDLNGEIVTTANKYLGTVRKYIPFGEVTENGYHIPQILLDVLRRRKYQKVRSVKQSDGTEVVQTVRVPEYTINILEPLTEAEIAELATTQAASNRV